MKITYTLFLSLFLGLFVMFSGCGSTDTVDSKDVSEKQIYRIYHVTYDAKDASSYIGAQFRVGGMTGTTVRLTDPSSVTVSGASLLLNDAEKSVARTLFTGTSYSLSDKTITPADRLLFSWLRKDGLKYEDSVTLAKSVQATSVKDGTEIKKTESLTVTLDSEATGSEDRISAIISLDDIAREEGKSGVAVSSTSNGSKIFFSTSELQKLGSGKATLVIKHETRSKIAKTDDSLGGSISSSYTSKPVSINLVD